jgi:TRAP-type C4-dicarboxylate transport system permease small subunit
MLDLDYYLAALTLVSMTLVAVVAVFYRFVLNDPLLWSDELVKLLFTWFCFTGMSVVAKHTMHLRVDILDKYLSSTMAIALRAFSDMVILGVLTLLAVHGVRLCVGQASNQFASLPLSRAWSFSALPAGAVLMALRLAGQIVQEWGKYTSGKAEVGG